MMIYNQERNNSMTFNNKKIWAQQEAKQYAKPRIDSVQDDSLKQNSSQKTVINRYREARSARRHSAARSNRDRHRFSFDFMGRGIEGANYPAG